MNKELTQKKNLFSNVNWRTYTMVFALIAIAIFFQIITDGTFFKSRNLSNLIRTMSITGVIATATVLMIVSGNFDLAVGSVVGITGGVAALLQVNMGWSTPVVILVALCVGIGVGLWQGFWVAYRKVPSFIVTLGGMMMFRGLYLVMTDGITITPMQDSFTFIGQGFLPKEAGYALGVAAIVITIFMLVEQRNSRKRYGLHVGPMWQMVVKMILFCALIALFVFLMNDYNGIPIPVLICVAMVILFTWVATKTRFGRNVYAIGGNVEAARLSGINVKRNVLGLYVLTGLMAALSGVLLTARMNGATANAGTSYEMDVISACVLGGTSLAGGKGTVVGAVIGALIIASLDNGMSLLNISYNYQSIVKGLVLILAVWFDVANQQKK